MPTRESDTHQANQAEVIENPIDECAGAGRQDNLILIGFMGTGKSTIGALCADLLGYRFRDTDSIIIERAGRSIPTIFAEEGEPGFRKREQEVIAEVSRERRQVIATGGGAILDPNNAASLQRAGTIASLHAQPITVLHRVGPSNSRPLLSASSDPEMRVKELMLERSPIYSAFSSRAFETDIAQPQTVARNIVEWYRTVAAPSEQIDVQLGSRSYPILIGDGLLTGGNAAHRIRELASADRVFIVTHPALRETYSNPLAQKLRALGVEVTIDTIPPGERYKTLRTVERLYDRFITARLDRKSLVISVGGGVLGDTAGFAAATYLRGIRVVQAPTTLLAQVDSSVGGKTGVDLAAGKNLIGAFHQPSLVVIDPGTLASLPRRELRSGLAEVIKYGIIFDATFFAEIGRSIPNLLRRERASLGHAISRSCGIKAEVVAQDETEQGLRAILNFGHTVGHALESVTAFRRYKHGEAISIGMITAALVGEVLGVTAPSVTDSIRGLLIRAGLPVSFPSDIESGPVLDAALLDKKIEGGRLRFVLARSIGDVYVHADVPARAVAEAINRQRAGVQ